MSGVLVGFSIIGFVILVGYLIERAGFAGPTAGFVLNRVAFFVAMPALMFTVLSHTDVRVLFSWFLLTTLCTVLVIVVVYLVASRFLVRRRAIGGSRRRDRVAETALGVAGAGYVNANNIGLPVAIYVLGSAHYVAPVLLLQLLVFAPILLGILDVATSGRVSVGSILTQPFRNPLILASLSGLIVAVFRIPIPDAVFAPLDILGGAGVPMVLLSFGMSLHGDRILRPGSGRKQVALAATLKVAVMPVVAWAFGRFVFGLGPAELFAVVTVAALPTAQNVFNYAARYDRGMVVARDTVLVTTIAAIPALLVIAALLAPAA
ncbi:AEC family transporter [Cryobacterium glucosi]|uniref:AEC family transporter n=1 Tax=Cryobacterium glucosi TaxID=1259175 RepID=A0ABY2IJJ8_9MICO|nr:AEC family transporter [Cryobacterium glucosi]TFC18277.1 AEC family transporter [Cryobacterium glucosi]